MIVGSRVVPMPLNVIDATDRVRQHHGDLTSLVESLATVGLLHPVIVNSDGVLVSGGRRVAAARHLGWTEIPAIVNPSMDDLELLLVAERDENTCRLAFTPSEMVEAGRRIEHLFKNAAKQRQGTRTDLASVVQPPGKLPESHQEPQRQLRENFSLSEEFELDGNLPQSGELQHHENFSLSGAFGSRESGVAADRIAAAVGTSRPTLAKAREVVDAAEDPDAPTGVREAALTARAEMDATGKVDPAFQKVREAKTQARKRSLSKEEQRRLDDEETARRAARILAKFVANWPCFDSWRKGRDREVINQHISKDTLGELLYIEGLLR